MPFATMLYAPPVDGQAVAITDEDRDALRSIFTDSFKVPAGTDLIQEEISTPCLYGIEEGWLACYTLLPQGQRQVIRLRVPGDLIGLRDLTNARASHSAVTLTAVEGKVASTDAMLRLIEVNPRLSAVIIWLQGREEASSVRDLANLGQRRAAARTAALIKDIADRLDGIGRLNGEAFEMPVPHAMLADALGISQVHISRVLRQLREADILELSDRKVRILSEARLDALIDGQHPLADL